MTNDQAQIILLRTHYAKIWLSRGGSNAGICEGKRRQPAARWIDSLTTAIISTLKNQVNIDCNR